ncbi:MAG: hypothetical protein PHC66_00320 [Candidatus Nanoarchaeia archaeon]|nr:hypothetical protein [Candidatus Nanoarchaeia archaeon]MDD5239606.1 hypothetical protein [Candidatus Nanoarchaeia archaeon]
MGIEKVFVPIEKSETAERLRDPELLKFVGESLGPDINPTKFGKIIDCAIKTYPAEYNKLFLGHTDICPVTQKPYSTDVADGRHVYCGQCGGTIGAIVCCPTKH